MAASKLVTLGDGLELYTSSAMEARFIYDEVFRSGCYDVLDLPERPFVIDVGANIGIFVLFLKQRYPDAEVLAFEPIPQSADLLQRNIIRHELDSVTVHRVALGQAAERQVPFTYYPMVPGNSTRHPETKAATKAALAESMPERLIERMYRGREVAVDTARLSTFLPTGRPVDLLKIDVEGAEVEVLHGIDPAHWRQIRRVVLEVHDVGGRLDAAGELLTEHGFTWQVQPAMPDAAESPAHLIHATAGHGR